jgi:CRISPR-associated protein Csd1
VTWLQKLYETYEACLARDMAGESAPLPVSHAQQQAHIEIEIDAEGTFKTARVLNKVETYFPATEQSAGRSGTKAPPHPLCDKLVYCAKTYPAFGGKKVSFFSEYEALLSAWCNSKFSHTKAEAVLRYVRSEKLIDDLIDANILHVDQNKILITKWVGPGPAPELFRMLTAKAGERDQGDAFVRWHVWEKDNPGSAVWEDTDLQKSWAQFDASTKTRQGLCIVTGNDQVVLAVNHPKRIRHAGDGAKLISANDSTGFTFRGRFTDSSGLQACGVGYEVTQKAHSALRWLIQRQAYRKDEQVIVTWAVAGKSVPDPFKDSLSLFLDEAEIANTGSKPPTESISSVGQAFARRLNRAIAGYQAKLAPTDDIVVLGLDSATPGRMAISYYRELKSSAFLERIQSWHMECAWMQDFGADRRFVGAPSPRDIAEAAFGKKINDKLRKSTIERLLPCIIEGRRLPRDLVNSAVHRAASRNSMQNWEWEKTLGIACALFSSYFYERGYTMSLESDRTTRDYLFGRLLAVAEHLEGLALHLSGEKRDTTAAKLMQRFADRPASTWRTIELAIIPSKSRLRIKRPGFM